MRGEMKITNGSIQDSMKNMVGSMSDGLVEFVVNGKASFSDFTRSILIDIAKVATKKLFTSFAASLFADGGVIEGGVSKFAKGGVFGGGVTRCDINNIVYRLTSLVST
jgi:lambda family phage tail tape measure protein